MNRTQITKLSNGTVIKTQLSCPPSVPSAASPLKQTTDIQSLQVGTILDSQQLHYNKLSDQYEHLMMMFFVVAFILLIVNVAVFLRVK